MNFSRNFCVNFILFLLFCTTTVACLNFQFRKHFQNAILSNVDPEVQMNASELITSKGYPCEVYEVKTQDGFILGIQRIPHGKNKNDLEGPRPVVFLQHGLLCASTNWLTNLVNESFAYLLADAGYDVWLGNIRGNTYSRKHIKYTPDQNEFWAWSWDEMAKYDIPAMINFVLDKTKQPQLHYVAHSQGTLIMFAHLSQNQQFAQKIKAFYALGPVATVKDIESPFRLLAYYTTEIQDLFKILGVKDFLPNSEIFKILGSTVCKFFTRVLCENVLFLIAGYDAQHLNSTRLPVYIAHVPAGTSVRNMVHFAQMVRSGNFQMYNYGSEIENMKHYQQKQPPLYNISSVNVPVALFSAQYDWLADPWDVENLKAKLPQIIYQEEVPAWDHLDFIWATDAPQVVYRKIMKMMKNQNAKPMKRVKTQNMGRIMNRKKSWNIRIMKRKNNQL